MIGKETSKTLCEFVVITVSADGLTLLNAMATTGSLMLSLGAISLLVL